MRPFSDIKKAEGGISKFLTTPPIASLRSMANPSPLIAPTDRMLGIREVSHFLPSFFSVCIDQLRIVLKMLCPYALACLHSVNVDGVLAWSMHRNQAFLSMMILNAFFVSFLG